MPKPTKKDRIIHRKFILRQKIYENKYQKVFLNMLAKQFIAAAKVYPATYAINPNDYKSAIESIYRTCIPNEAQIAWEDYVKPLTSDRKDIFDELASILGFLTPEADHLRMWREIANEWLNINILTKITEISGTTQKAIARVINKGVNEGLGESDIAKLIRDESKGEINQYRSRLIARTETISAMNKGRRVSMYTSNLVWNKKWVDTADERTRTSHRIVANRASIPLDDKYEVPLRKGGFELGDCPGDQTMSAENCCNCRCVETYIVQRDSSGRPKRKTSTSVNNIVNII